MSSENQFLVTISGIPGTSFWASKSGGDASVSVTKDYDGGSDEADISFSRQVWSDLVIGRRYDVDRDAALNLTLLGQLRTDRVVTVQPSDASFNAIGPATSYRCTLVGVTTPAVNANGSAPARFQLTFAVKGLAA
jgi:hypothetical protein